MKTIHAIYENGVFRPTQPVDLPEGATVIIQTATVDDPIQAARLRVFDTLSHSYEGGDPHAAERHNEHQP